MIEELQFRMSRIKRVKICLRYIFLPAALVCALSGVRAQDRIADIVSMQTSIEGVDTVAMRTMLLNEAHIIPMSDMYPEWVNHGVHYNAALPDSFVIDMSGYSMPTPSTKVTDVFGYRPRRRRVHQGIDIKVQTGDTIYAAFDGKVRIASYQRRGYGNYVVIRHENGIETLYGHLSKKLVVVDQNVKSGDPIGLGGNTGRSSGSHLHFETILMGKSINPAFLFDFKSQKAATDRYVYRKPGTKYVENGKVKTAGPEPKYHKVRRGDTVSKIAHKHGVSQKTIFRLNGINGKTVLRPGMTLRYQ